MESLLESGAPLAFLAPYVQKYREVFSLTWEETMFHPTSPNNRYIHITPVIAIALYIMMLFFLPKVVPKGGVGKLKAIMFLWNGFLCVLSIGMFLGSLFPYVVFLQKHGVWNTVCATDYAVFYEHPTLLFWSYVFAWSKYAELLDTFFIIVRGGKPQLLHTWHHISVLAFTWYAAYYKLSVGYIFEIVNAFIHTLMYYYYAVASIGYRPSWAFWLTMGQITQMFVGIACIGVWVYGTYFTTEPCACTHPTIISSACFIMYASYAYLFIEFAIKRYCNPRAKKVQTKKRD